MRHVAWFATFAILTALPVRPSMQHTPAPHGQAAGSHGALSARYQDLTWETMNPELGAASPQQAILRVDPETRATQLLIRIPRQMHVPLHWHSANETHTVIKGIFVFEHGGRSEELGPGGFNYLPARMHHQAWASDGALVFITVDGAWDVNWVNGPPTSSDLGQAAPAR